MTETRVWQVGERVLDLYEVRAVHGEGGMGLVHRVRHVGWDTELAVKSPRPDMFRTDADRDRFVREAQVWVELGLHPNVCGCHYVRTVAEVPRVFAEYVAGGSLRAWIDDGRLYRGTPDEVLARVLDIAVQVAWGLAHAHRNGVVHQDVKPGNVLLDTDRGTGAGGLVAKLTDFGLARARRSGTDESRHDGHGPLHTQGGLTPAYASPEQVRGAPSDVRTDVFSFGATVLEMITGEVTWGAGPAAGGALLAHRFSPGVPPLPRLPPALADLLDRCLRDDPAERPAGATELADELSTVYGGEIGKPYPRRQPDAAEFRADEFSNRALSLLDLGRRADAERELTKARQADPQHPETVYNLGLLRWRSGERSGEDLVADLHSALASARAGGSRTAQLLAQIHLERGDPIRARQSLDTGDQTAPDDAGLRAVAQASRSADWAWAAGGLIHTLTGHTGQISSVDVTAEGRCAVSGDEDGRLLVWDTVSGRRLLTCTAHGAGVTAVSLNAAGTLALSADTAGRLLLWDPATGTVRGELTGHTAAVRACRLSDDGRRAVSGDAEGMLRWWDVTTGECLRVLALPRRDERYPAAVEGVSLTADGETALVSSGGMAVWHLPTGTQRDELDGLMWPVALSADGRRALVARRHSGEHTLTCWDLVQDCPLWTSQSTGEPTRTAVIAADGSYAVSGEIGGMLRMWDMATGRCLRSEEADAAVVMDVAISANGSIVVTAGAEETVRVWQLPVPGTYTAPYQICRPRVHAELVEHTDRVTALVRAATEAVDRQRYPDALALITEARALPGHERDERALAAWHRLSLHCRRTGVRGAWLDRTVELPSGGTDVAVTADGSRALSADLRGLRWWDLDTGECLRVFDGTDGIADEDARVESVALGPDGTYAATGHRDGRLRLWELAGGTCVRVFDGAIGPVGVVSLSHDGRWVLGGDAAGSVTCWEAATGNPLFRYPAHLGGVTSLCLSADGRYLLSSGHDLDVQLWRVSAAGGRRVRLYPEINYNAGKQVLTGDIVYGAALTTDGRHVVTANNDGRVRVWDAATTRLLCTADEHADRYGHAEGIDALSLSVDGRYAVTAGRDHQVRLLDVTTGRWLRTLTGHLDDVRSVSLAADGRYAVSIGWDNTVRRWEIDWELTAVEPADWDPGAQHLLDAFLTRTSGSAGDQSDGDGLLRELGRAGFGWLRPDGVRTELLRQARGRPGPPERF